ncbi:MAG: 16S rRNA (cytosine(1402)-N(4))-methyltransferase RsmH [Candidatus Paceibacterota bacterium]
MTHIPVLLDEVLDLLDPQEGEIFVDGTIGNGGHAREIGKKLGASGTIIGLDEDSEALKMAEENLSDLACTTHLIRENARNITQVLDDLEIKYVDGILLDLGIRSEQIDSSGRGFSFKGEEPLLMTFNPHPKEDDLTASTIVNQWDGENIEAVISGYGEERYARRITEAIISTRKESPINTTKDLREIIEEAVPARYRRGRIHPATRTFQALRIAVNDEIEALREVLRGGWGRLGPNGRFAVISFHSLEDRVVKHFFKRQRDALIHTKKPLQPSEEERAENPRARSAKLRVAERQ